MDSQNIGSAESKTGFSYMPDLFDLVSIDENVHKSLKYSLFTSVHCSHVPFHYERSVFTSRHMEIRTRHGRKPRRASVSSSLVDYIIVNIFILILDLKETKEVKWTGCQIID